ncbi:2-hydroxyacid dehydrogenase [Massilia yuzhufengensis]|uniref:Glyoxylate/hydroxypyruvate reductase A n=1 Tax=Massilia yuzhufengensis TaxID=1164594 RepID=A0A1I1D6Q1_9BURK|nr:glyoxylate/hydroxypyruvate reductase A [Massilia yuzhufengensis]SFB70679.1 glyoxylate/hydroxypyruvate reductase A [Massilia yuzhufengensis]
MRILLYRADGVIEPWVREFAALMPQVETVAWKEGQSLPPCDYAVVWSPEPALLDQLAHVRAIFLMGAGVDALLKLGAALPPVPIVRLGDAGMGVQMAEYVAHAVLRYFRRFEEYEQQARHGAWNPLPQTPKEEFTIGIMGLGRLGLPVVEALRVFGFTVRGWSRTPKDIPGVECFHGADGLDPFLRATRVLVCMLPLTPDTSNLLDRHNLGKLLPGAYLINVSRGAILAEPDLMTLIRSGHIVGATLDVFRHEPLPAPHPFWNEPRIAITPHISALTIRHDAVRQIAEKITALENGQPVGDIVDRDLGY